MACIHCSVLCTKWWHLVACFETPQEPLAVNASQPLCCEDQLFVFQYMRPIHEAVKHERSAVPYKQSVLAIILKHKE